jgi:hypothetical protein
MESNLHLHVDQASGSFNHDVLSEASQEMCTVSSFTLYLNSPELHHFIILPSIKRATHPLSVEVDHHLRKITKRCDHHDVEIINPVHALSSL